MGTRRRKQNVAVWLSGAAACYALLQMTLQGDVIKNSFLAFFNGPEWMASAVVVAIAIGAALPLIPAVLVARGVRSWWLVAPLVLSAFILPSLLAAGALVTLVIWLMDRSDAYAT